MSKISEYREDSRRSSPRDSNISSRANICSDPIKSSTSVFAAGEDFKVFLLSILFTRKINTQTCQRRKKPANCRMVRAAAGYQIQSHTHSLLTLLSLITLVTMHTAFFLGNIDKFGHLTSVSDLTIPRLRHHRLPITIQSCPKYFHRGEIEIVAFLYFR